MGAIMAFRSFLLFLVLGPMVFITGCDRKASSAQKTESRGSARSDLWRVYDRSLKGAKYIDLTHTLTPSIPVWKGFAPAKFAPTTNPETGQPYTYKMDGFEATHYDLPTDQFGTQLDPPAHWAPEFPAIDELPATYAVRPLAVISIVDQVAKDPGYHLWRSDIESWEKRNGKIPAGSVVMVRSDWSKRWPDPALASQTVFPGVSLEALQFLHEERRGPGQEDRRDEIGQQEHSHQAERRRVADEDAAELLPR